MKILRELRRQNGKTQQQIADLLNVTQQTYGRYELDLIEPPYEILSKLADYYGVSTDYILGRVNEATTAVGKQEQITLDGIYFHLAKEAQEIGLSKKDIDFILDFYKKAKEEDEK